MNRQIPIKGLSALALATLFLAVASFLFSGTPRKAAAWLLVWSGFQSMAAFYGFTWALSRSDRAFYSIFVGDALLRLVVLAAAVYALDASHTPFAIPLLSLAMGYLALSVVQIPFLRRLPS